MDTSIFNELSIIIVIGAGISLLMRLLRQPLIIGYILTGLIVGPSALDLIKSPETFDVFSSIGITLLLFIIGLGLNPRIIREVGKVASVSGTFQIGLCVIFGYTGAFLLGYTRTESIFVGTALAFSSTIIILKLLSDKKEQTRLYGKITVGVLLVQDIVATLSLIIVTARTNGGFSGQELLWLTVKGFLLGAPLFIVSTTVLPRLKKLIAGSQEFLFLFAIGWGFGAAALFEHFGFSIEIGALFAGVALAGLPYAQEISARLRPLRDFFVIVFFISLGSGLVIENISSVLPAILLFSGIAIIAKPFVVLIIMGLLGYTKRTSFKTAVALAQVSEFSLVLMILGEKQDLISAELVSVMTVVALVSITISTYLIIYADKLYDIFERHLALFERRKANEEHEIRHHYDLVLFGYKKGGAEFIKVFQSLKKNYVVVDYDPEVIESLEQKEIHHLYGDATDIELLEEANLEHARLIVSVVSDFPTNMFLTEWLSKNNSEAVFITPADNLKQASDLYDSGASYVMLPHYIGSEKISAFIKRSGLRKSEFKKYREKHLAYLHEYFDSKPEQEHLKIGHAILEKLEKPISIHSSKR